ncbi:hypothetical protein [Shewanella woodyi]|uniref:Lipoprotein n=1 Tax=Shewanella woodyi (strain ATCC 51908 / MS32) TaxID=392500 RepID=B1KKE1_SHEWM|nr:hypothetical protein [Shewanella woodyi]ACA85781.1 conserved hypothetical protein [Shewanella woodyi ATCC 51908]
MKIFIHCLCLFLLFGCANKSFERQDVSYSFSEPNRIQFQGKGAGAGIALMSTMGPVGIALGVAIDEGIAKDIRESAVASGFDMPSYVVKSVDKHSQSKLNPVVIDLNYAGAGVSNELPSIEVKRYGFKTTGGADDATAAELIVIVKTGKGEQFEYYYPNDFNATENGNKSDEVPSYPLAEIKTNGELSVLLMQQAVDIVIGKVVEKNLDSPVESLTDKEVK